MAVDASSTWPRNRLLLALPSRNLKRLMPELEQIRCLRALVLMNADSSLDHVFFPDSGVVSVVAVYASGSIIEMATIGREGCSGAVGGSCEDAMPGAAAFTGGSGTGDHRGPPRRPTATTRVRTH